MGVAELHGLCRRRGFRLALELVDATSRPLRSEPGARYAFLRFRVYDRDGQVLAGRSQSDPGRESVEVLAECVLGTLQRRGLVT